MAVYGLDVSWATFTTRAGQRLYVADDNGNIKLCFAVDASGNMYVYSQYIPIPTSDPWFATALQLAPGSELSIGGS